MFNFNTTSEIKSPPIRHSNLPLSWLELPIQACFPLPSNFLKHLAGVLSGPQKNCTLLWIPICTHSDILTGTLSDPGPLHPCTVVSVPLTVGGLHSQLNMYLKISSHRYLHSTSLPEECEFLWEQWHPLVHLSHENTEQVADPSTVS